MTAVTNTISASGPEPAPPAPATAPAAPSGLRTRAIRGSAWTFGSYAFGNALRLVSNLVLAHVLFPEAFALTALAGIVLQALTMFSDLGIAPSIVHSKRGDDPAFLNTAWTVQVLRGILLWLASCALAWPMAKFYDAPELVWVIPACGLTCIVSGLQSTKLHIRTRELNLGLITVLATCENILKMAITVAWALIWPSVWAIVGGSVIAYAMFTLATHTLLPGIKNRFAWEKEAARQLLHFGGWVFLSTSVTFLAMQSDRLILGRLVPLDVLGVYSIAFMFSKLPSEIGSRIASQVQFPALAEVFRTNPARMEAKLLESRRLILAVMQAGALGIVIVAPWFFTLLYDDRYVAAAAFAPLIAIAAWPAMLQSAADRALLAMGDARALALSNGANALFTVAGCILGHMWWGMPGFIAGTGLGNLAGHGVIVWALAGRGVKIWRQDLAYSALVLLVAGVVIAASYGSPDSLGSTPVRVIIGAIGLAIAALLAARECWPLVSPMAQRVLSRYWHKPANAATGVGTPTP